MSDERNIQAFRRIIEEGFGKGNFGVLDDLFAPGYREHQFMSPATLEEFKQSTGGLRAAFPDLTITIEDVIAQDDKVWARSTARGTHLGAWMGLPATGARFEIEVIDICRFEGGKVVEHWGVPDRFAQLVQLGLLPKPSDRVSS